MNGGNQSSTVQSMLYVTLCTSCTDYNTHLFSCLISQKTYGPILIPKNRDVPTCIHLTTAMGDVFHPVVPLSAMKGYRLRIVPIRYLWQPFCT